MREECGLTGTHPNDSEIFWLISMPFITILYFKLFCVLRIQLLKMASSIIRWFPTSSTTSEEHTLNHLKSLETLWFVLARQFQRNQSIHFYSKIVFYLLFTRDRNKKQGRERAVTQIWFREGLYEISIIISSLLSIHKTMNSFKYPKWLRCWERKTLGPQKWFWTASNHSREFSLHNKPYDQILHPPWNLINSEWSALKNNRFESGSKDRILEKVK